MESDSTKESKIRFRLMLLFAIVTLLYLILVVPFQRWGNGARYNQNATVQVEIVQLEQALSTFRIKYGTYPSSDLTIREDAGLWDPVSRTTIRRLWPQFDFSQKFDLNNDGDTDDVHVLNGAECLVFFLGGARDKDGRLNGFSKNPLFPFSHSGFNRSGPFFEFDKRRLVDVDEDGFYEYVDEPNVDSNPQAPYLYIVREAYGGFRSAGLTVFSDDTDRNLEQPYDIEGSSVDYQIISPGFDGQYGLGGTFVPQSGRLSGARKAEADNLTNFSDGPLE